jgi:hypothetical protein
MAEKPAKETEINVELIPALEPKLGRVYANYALISHSPWDFTITFCEAPSISNLARLKRIGSKVEIPNIVELIIAPNLIPKIIEALKINYEKYMKQYGEKVDEPSS